MDASPLLNNRSVTDHLVRSRRLLRRQPPPLGGAAARLLRRAGGRRMMLREPSVRVRENAAEQLEERQTDWAYSKPVIFLDILWNLAFVGTAVVVLGLSVKEEPQVPLRVWIIGYGLQCLFHIGCVIFECKRRVYNESNGRLIASDSSSVSDSDSVDYGGESLGTDDETSSVKQLESVNTMFSFIWWIVGFYWVTSGGQNITHDSPQLYWLCITFLAFDVIFVIICVAVASLIGLAICCCLPCIIGLLYAMTDREGATKEDIEQLPTYKFQRIGEFEKSNGEIRATFGGMMTRCKTDSPTERLLSHEDAECCICLCAYEDGTELRELPCHHHFHSTCIDKWLYINAICPLCKLNILKATNNTVGEEV